jgi:hypothetical protein
MIKTQVQIPDHLYHEAKRISAEYEMSFAEVVRRGLERLAPSYPPRKNAGKWSPPKPRKLGWRGLSVEDLKEQAQMTSFEEQLIEERRKASAP